MTSKKYPKLKERTLNWKVGQNKGQFYGEGKRIRANKFCLSKKEKKYGHDNP